MKRVYKSIVVILMLLFVSTNCFAEYVYPEYSVENTGSATITERINIVFDNTGHQYVKKMLIDVVKAAAVAENTAIWIYPIAGNAEPIQVVAGKEFAQKYFTLYSKSSNEFKPENVIEKAREDILNDNTVTTKRLILYVDNRTKELRPEYSNYDGWNAYMTDTPNVLFSTFRSQGDMVSNTSQEARESGVYEYLSTSGIFDFVLVKNGYSFCDSVYDAEQGILKIEKGKGDNNIFVFATDEYYFGSRFDSDESSQLYLSGCMMGTSEYEDYQKGKNVTGVALSYNHTLLEAENDENSVAFAVYTADEVNVNPLEDDIYIPLVNAEDVKVYKRNTKGAGICSAETTYNVKQDKEVINLLAPEEDEITEDVSVNVDVFDFGDSFMKDKTDNVGQKIFSSILGVLSTILGIIFTIIRLLIFAFIVLLIASRKFRSYVQLKLLNTKYGSTYEKILIKIKKIISDIMGAGAKIKGDADIKGDYIFISKASADMGLPNNRITLLVRELESRGISCWLSENGIKAGEDYNVVLPRAIKNCTLFLIFVSPMSVKSSEVISEVGTAKEHKKNIIPVQIDPFDLFKEFPNWAYMLKQYQKIDLFTSKQDDIKILADQIESAYNELKIG